MRRALVLIVLSLSLAAGCKSSGEADRKADPAPVAPPQFAERDAVLEAIREDRLADAEATLKSAGNGADVHYLRAKLALARQDGDTAYREITKAVEAAPSWPEYQYELGVIAPLPVGGLDDAQLELRLARAGAALKKAVELSPREPRYLYAYAFFLSSAPPRDGGDPAEGRKLFDRIVADHRDSLWAHRVLFDRAAESGDLGAAEIEAAKVGALDANEGARLWLLIAGSRLVKGQIDGTRDALEAAAKLKTSAAGGFCDAGFALDGGGNEDLAEPFWKRCLELDPEGPKSAKARARLGV